jgi:hypothetical protein
VVVLVYYMSMSGIYGSMRYTNTAAANKMPEKGAKKAWKHEQRNKQAQKAHKQSTYSSRTTLDRATTSPKE